MSLFRELKRRNVFRVGIAYLAASWLLIEVAETIFPLYGFGNTPARMVVTLLAIGFPLFLVFSWVFEITPEGLKLEKDVRRDESITPLTGKKLDRIIIVLLALALGYLAFDRFLLGPVRDAELVEKTTQQARSNVLEQSLRDKSIAVLPFQNRSANEENAAFFADGVHDELLTNLSKIGDLKVISHTSVMHFRESDKSMREIGEALSVATLLVGGVQRAGDQLRVNVQLIDASTDEHLWAETYDRELTTESIFAIQSGIALAIADALQAALSPEVRADLQRAPTASLEAYELYLLAAQLSDHMNWDSLEKALEYADRATGLDPEFQQAFAQKAHILIGMCTTGARTLEAVRRPIEAAIDRAVELDPHSAVAYAARAGYLGLIGAPEAAEEYEKALRLEPNTVDVLVNYARNRLEASDPERALELIQRAREIDPLSLKVLHILARTWMALGQPDRALETFARIREIDSSSVLGTGNTAGPYFYQGLIAHGLFWVHEGWKRDPADLDLANWVVRNYMDLGDFEAASSWMRGIVDANPDFPFTLANRAVLEVERGELENAVPFAVEHLTARQDNRWGSEATATDVLLIDAVRRSEPSTALSLLRARRPGLFDSPPAVDAETVLQAINAAQLLRLAEEEEKALELLRAVIEFADRPYALTGSPPGYWRVSAKARALALLGEKHASLVELQMQIGGGWRVLWRWQIGHSPNFDGLRDEPAFREMVEFLKGDMRRQLQEVRAMEARGEIPPPPSMSSRRD
jgi:TolB-like protein